MTSTTRAATPAGTPVLTVLARQEIRNYLRHKLFWIGAGLLAVFTALMLAAPGLDSAGGADSSSTEDMIVPAALLGLLGMIVMAGLVRRSDRAAEAAGAVAVPERTRTLALAAAVVVPLAAALVWFAAALIAYGVHPPAPSTVPFGGFGPGDVLTVMFATGVVPAAGGPLLGLVIARWLPRRGVVPLAVVLVVLVTILLQGNFRSTWRWHVVWPWTAWYGPLGFNSGNQHWTALPGSPQAWLLYLLAVCALGVLAAVHHDPESDRTTLLRSAAGVFVIAVVALVLTLTLGLPAAIHNPIAVPGA